MRKLYLSNEYKFFGVCGGIGEAFDVDPTAVRIATVFLCIITGGLPLLATYFAAWILKCDALLKLRSVNLIS